MWDDSSVHVNVGLNHAHVGLLAAPRVGRHHDHPGASRGRQIWHRQEDWCLNSARQQPQFFGSAAAAQPDLIGVICYFIIPL